MSKPQNSPRGVFAKSRIEISPSGGIVFHDYSTSTAAITADSNGVAFAGRVAMASESELPSTDGGDYKIVLVVNSTGVAGLAINTTGTTWSYCRMTSVINST